MYDANYLLGRFRHFRDSWSDEIPERRVDSTSKERIKARTSWFSIIELYLGLGIKCGVLDTGAAVIEREFLHYIRDLNGDNLTTPENIHRGNKVLDYVINYLETELNERKTSAA